MNPMEKKNPQPGCFSAFYPHQPIVCGFILHFDVFFSPMTISYFHQNNMPFFPPFLLSPETLDFFSKLVTLVYELQHPPLQYIHDTIFFPCSPFFLPFEHIPPPHHSSSQIREMIASLEGLARGQKTPEIPAGPAAAPKKPGLPTRERHSKLRTRSFIRHRRLLNIP